MPPAVPPDSQSDGPPAASPEAVEHKETELKLVLDPAHLDRVRRHPGLRRRAQGSARTRRLHSVYFDTSDLALTRAGFSLRVRREGRRFVQTVKGRQPEGGGLLERMEIESPIPAPVPDLHAVPDPDLSQQLVAIVDDRPLESVLETDVRRSTWRLHDGDTWIDADLDTGEIRTPAGVLQICELELELVRGDPSVLYEVALEIHEATPLRLALDSKFDRGLALLTGARPEPVRAKRIRIAPDATLEAAVEQVLRTCVEQVLVNETPAYYGSDPEGVHQMRVGVRRLRSALSLFGGVLPHDAVSALRKELRWLADALGRARDLDVFVGEVLEPVLAHAQQDPAIDDLRGAAAALREEAYEALRGALDSERYTALVLRLGGWVERRAWREQVLSPESARLFQPARLEAAELLRNRYRKVRKLGRGAARAPAERLHALRIALKKLRYATDFVGSAFDTRAARRYAREVASVQARLGRLNDGWTAERLLDEVLERIGPTADERHSRATGFVLGWLAREGAGTRVDASSRFKKLKQRRTFWQ